MGFVTAAKVVENMFNKEILIILGIPLFKPTHPNGNVRPKITNSHWDLLKCGNRIIVQVTFCYSKPTVSILTSKAGQVNFDGFDRRRVRVE